MTSTSELDTPNSEAQSRIEVNFHQVLEEFLQHLDLVGEPCHQNLCLICGQTSIANEVTRLTIARFEYLSHSAMLRRHVLNELCAYCGDLPSDRDHLIPRNWSGDALRRHVPTVAACRDCNQTLSDFPQPSIVARAHHISGRIKARDGNFLRNTPNLDGLEGSLLKRIKANNFNRFVLKGRLLVLESGGVSGISEQWQDLLLGEGPSVLAIEEASKN